MMLSITGVHVGSFLQEPLRFVFFYQSSHHGGAAPVKATLGQFDGEQHIEEVKQFCQTKYPRWVSTIRSR